MSRLVFSSLSFYSRHISHTFVLPPSPLQKNALLIIFRTNLTFANQAKSNFLQGMSLSALVDQTRPVLHLLRRTTDNLEEDPETFVKTLKASYLDLPLKKPTARHHARIFLVCAWIFKNVLLGSKRVTQRELFYCLKSQFKDQRQCNSIILDISGLLQLSRSSLGILAEGRGLVFGDLKIVCSEGSGKSVDCTSGHQTIHYSLLEKTVFLSKAKYIIVVEKEGIFFNLVEGGLCKNLPCILVTGKGYPSLDCRALVKRLNVELELPCFGMFDYNPHGLAILMSFKLGSANMALESSQYTVPSMKWLGMHHSDAEEVPATDRKRFSLTDLRMCQKLLETQFIAQNSKYKKEVEAMTQTHYKVDLQALLLLKGWNFLASCWVPNKILSWQYI
eukprot:g65554.t1